MNQQVRKRSITVFGAVLLVVVALITTAQSVFAYTYYSVFTVTNTGSSYTMLPVGITIDNATLASNYYISASGLDTNVYTSANRPHMVASDRTLYAAAISTGTNTAQYRLGDTPNTAFNILTGYNGYITVADAAALEGGAAFSYEFSGYFNTSTGSNKYIANKSAAFTLQNTSASQITASIYPPPSSNQSYATGITSAGIYGANYMAQTFTPNASGYLTGLTLRLKKEIAPTGNLSVAIRATSGGKPTGADLVVATKAVADISTSVADVAFNFTTPLAVTNGTVYSIVAGGVTGDVGNYISWHYNTSDGYAGGTRVTSGDSGTNWTIQATHDQRFSVLITSPATIVANAQASGAHDYIVTLAGGTATLYDGVTSLGTVAVADMWDNSADFTFGQNNVAPYFTLIKLSVGGTLIAHYQPITIVSSAGATATLPDREGAAQNATITWGSNPAGVTVSVNALTPYLQSGATLLAPTSTRLDYIHTWEPPTNVAVDTSNPLYPAASLIASMSGGGLTTDLFIKLMWIAFIIAPMVGVVYITKGRHKIMISGIGLLMSTAAAAFGAFQWWLPLIYLFYMLGVWLVDWRRGGISSG